MSIEMEMDYGENYFTSLLYGDDFVVSDTCCYFICSANIVIPIRLLLFLKAMSYGSGPPIPDGKNELINKYRSHCNSLFSLLTFGYVQDFEAEMNIVVP